MNKAIFNIICYFISFTGFTQQNLVPNPGFEDTLGCPTSPGAVGLNMLELAKGWYKANSATSDYYNSCASLNSGVSVPQNWLGYQTAFDGNAYIGMEVFEGGGGATEVSEYAQCRLLSPMKPCMQYYVSFYTSLADYSSRATLGLGLRFDSYPIKKQQYTPEEYLAFDLPPHIAPGYTIKDTINWVLVSGYYTAKGGEQYLTIGRFLDTTKYSNFDPPYEVNDCDSCFFLGEPAYYYIDHVSVIEMEADETCGAFTNVITPNGDGINDVLDMSGLGIIKMEIYNRWGNEVAELTPDSPVWDGSCKNSPCSEGVYYYIADFNGYSIKGFIQLIR